jgi:hypothetical protein
LEGRPDVEGGGVALEEPVGEDQEPVAGLELERRGRVGGVGDPERRVGRDLEHSAVPPRRRNGGGVASVHDLHLTVGQADPRDEPGDELDASFPVAEGAVGLVRLLGG